MMHIAFCTDTNYVMPCGVAMTSICENNKEEEICFHLVITDEGTAPDEVEKKVAPLREIAEKYKNSAAVYRIDASMLDPFICSGVNHVSTTGFSRIFLPKILPHNIHKVLYLDCDLVCDGSIKELWNTELEDDCPVGAAVDCNYVSPAFHLAAQIPQSAHYVNSGVLLMNLDCWRKNNYTDLAVNIAIDKKFPLLDQDTINHIFCGKIHYLHPQYNLQIITLFKGVDESNVTLDFYNELKDACQNPVIVHYLGTNKPWKNEICLYCEYWDKYKDMTIWKDLKRGDIVTRFDRTLLYSKFVDTYWSDPVLFNKGLLPYLRFFQALVKLKNKKLFVRISSSFLNAFATFLEKVYVWKTRK